MRIHRFYTSENIPSAGSFDLSSIDFVHQLKNVFRFRVGDTVAVFNSDGHDYECLIERFSKDSVSLKVVKSYPSRFMPVREVWLCAAIVKKDNFEWIAEKATELGVSDILPVVSERSEKKSLNMERLSKIVLEASEQSGRGDVPEIHGIMELPQSLEFLKSNVQSGKCKVIAFHTEGDPYVDDIYAEGDLAVFIGPEGGWSDDEIPFFKENNIPVVSLGKQVLRAETAVIAALAKVIF